MEKFVMAFFTLVVVASFAVLARRAWVSKRFKQESLLSNPLEALDIFGKLIIEQDGFYVATTFANNSLERVAAYGLGSRGFCKLFVFDNGVLFVRRGERSIAVPVEQIASVGSGQVAIDKAVEPGGLIQIDWKLEDVFLTTHFRVTDTNARAKTLSALVQLRVGA